jgi:hypothetical protein
MSARKNKSTQKEDSQIHELVRVDPKTRQLVVETEDASNFSLPSHMDHIETHVKLLASDQLQHPIVPDLLMVVDQPKAK